MNRLHPTPQRRDNPATGTLGLNTPTARQSIPVCISARACQPAAANRLQLSQLHSSRLQLWPLLAVTGDVRTTRRVQQRSCGGRRVSGSPARPPGNAGDGVGRNSMPLAVRVGGPIQQRWPPPPLNSSAARSQAWSLLHERRQQQQTAGCGQPARHHRTLPRCIHSGFNLQAHPARSCPSATEAQGISPWTQRCWADRSFRPWCRAGRDRDICHNKR